jgi:hypothetical protein
MYVGGGAQGPIDWGARKKLEQQAIRIARLEAQVADLVAGFERGGQTALATARQQLDHARTDGQTALRDLAAILRALDLGDHARMISSHYVVTEEVLPAIEHLRQQLDQVRATFQRWSGGPDDEFEQTMRDLLDAPAVGGE